MQDIWQLEYVHFHIQIIINEIRNLFKMFVQLLNLP